MPLPLRSFNFLRLTSFSLGGVGVGVYLLLADFRDLPVRAGVCFMGLAFRMGCRLIFDLRLRISLAARVVHVVTVWPNVWQAVQRRSALAFRGPLALDALLLAGFFFKAGRADIVELIGEAS